MDPALLNGDYPQPKTSVQVFLSLNMRYSPSAYYHNWLGGLGLDLSYTVL
jgi:hypothetical protein